MSFLSTAARARDIARLVGGNATSVVFTKPKVVTSSGTTPATVLAAQTVRIESDSRPRSVPGIAGAAPMRQAYVFGVVDHPVQADTDMEEGYTFTLDGDKYRCIDVILRPGEKVGVFVVNG